MNPWDQILGGTPPKKPDTKRLLELPLEAQRTRLDDLPPEERKAKVREALAAIRKLQAENEQPTTSVEDIAKVKADVAQSGILSLTPSEDEEIRKQAVFAQLRTEQERGETTMPGEVDQWDGHNITYAEQEEDKPTPAVKPDPWAGMRSKLVSRIALSFVLGFLLTAILICGVTALIKRPSDQVQTPQPVAESPKPITPTVVATPPTQPVVEQPPVAPVATTAAIKPVAKPQPKPIPQQAKPKDQWAKKTNADVDNYFNQLGENK